MEGSFVVVTNGQAPNDQLMNMEELEFLNEEISLRHPNPLTTSCDSVANTAINYCRQVLKANNKADTKGNRRCCAALHGTTNMCGVCLNKARSVDIVSFIHGHTQPIRDVCGAHQSDDSPLLKGYRSASADFILQNVYDKGDCRKIAQVRDQALSKALDCATKANMVKDQVCTSGNRQVGDLRGGEKAACCEALENINGRCLCEIHHRKIQISNDTYEFYKLLADNRVCGGSTYSFLSVCDSLLNPSPSPSFLKRRDCWMDCKTSPLCQRRCNRDLFANDLV